MMVTPQKAKAAAPVGQDQSGGELGKCSSQALVGYQSPRKAASEDPGLRAWAARRAARLADEFVREDTCEAGAEAFFEDVCRRERLLAVLRSVAEPAFMARIRDLEGRR